MRVLTVQEQRTLQNATGRGSHVRVQVKDAGGAWRNLCALEGRDWLDSVELDENVDQPLSQATVMLKRDIDRFSMAPLRADSKLNTYGGAPLIRPGREFQVEVAVLPVDAQPASSDWRLLFHGDIDEVDFGGDQVTFRGRDLGGRLQDRFIEVERMYGTDAGVAVETVMQQLLTDNGTGLSLYTPTSPGWTITQFAQQRESVLDALRNLAQQIGWDVRYKWRASAGAYALTFYQPDRTRSSVDWIFNTSDYRDVAKLAVNRTDVRNRIEVVFSNKDVPDASGKPTRDKVIVEDTASQATYGLRYMQIAEGATSNLDETVEAQRMANAALSDLKEPLAEQEVECDFFWPAELGDLYTFKANGVHYSADQNLAVIGIRHSFGADGDARTTLTTRGRPSFGVSAWLELDTRPGMAEPAHNAPPLEPTNLVATPTVNGFALTLTAPARGPEVSAYELHVSTVNGFTPGAATLRGTFDATRFEVADLQPGTTYYVRVVPRDASGNRGTPTGQVAVTTARLTSDSLASGAVASQHLLLPPSDNLVPNGYSEAGAAALGKVPDGDSLIEDPVNAREGRWCRRKQLVSGWPNISFTGGWGSTAPSRIKCAAGDEFFAEVWVKASSTLAGAGGTLYLLWDDANGAYTGQNTGAGVNGLDTTYKRVTVRGTCPPGCTGVQLFWEYNTVAGDEGKYVYFDAVSLRKMVTFDLLAANTIKTSNYAEDGNGYPTAGAKLDNVGTALKVASNNMRVGRYFLSDAFFKSVQALGDRDSRIFYRGNCDPNVRGGAPNIDCLNIQLCEAWWVDGSTRFSWMWWRYRIQPSGAWASDNLDGLRYLMVSIYWAYSNTSSPNWITDLPVQLSDRRYMSTNDAGGENATWGHFSWGWGSTLNPQTSGGGPYAYLKVNMHNAYGPSDQRWYYPASGYHVDAPRSLTGPANSGTSTGGGTGGGGTCVAPWEPILMSDGVELPAELVRPGMQVCTQHEHSSEVGFFEVVSALRTPAQARFRLTTEDGRTVVATPNHRMRTRERGWVRLDALEPGETIDGLQPGRVLRVEPLDVGDVIRLTVRGAQTFQTKGLLSHNLKPRD